MAWLTSLLNKQETIEDEQTVSAEDALAAEEAAAEPPPAPSGPPLAILAPDIAGISSFRLRFFPDAATAAADLEQFPPEMRRGTHAFWALHDEPVLPPDGHREALVLIRANQTSDVVYAVSFVDLESAWSFARFEAKRGLDLSHLIVLWAAFAAIREELDGVSVLPAAAPATKAQHARTFPGRTAVEEKATEAVREYERRERPSISTGAAAPAAPEDEAQLAAAAAEAERRTQAAREAEAAEAARIARRAQEQLRAARAAADAARAQAEAEATRRLETERRLEDQRQAAETAARARALADMAASIESALSLPEAVAQEPVVMDATSGALEALAEGLTQPLAEGRSPTIEAPVDARSGAEETLTGGALDDGEEQPVASGTVFAHAPAVETTEDTATVEIPEHLRRADEAAGPADDTPKVPELDEFDIAYEVARLLENRRWARREEPFQGFESPPGRF